MGKASKWFRGLFGPKKQHQPQPPQTHSTPSYSVTSSPNPTKHKRRWTFVKSYRENHHPHHHHQQQQHVDASSTVDPDKHAIAVAAATAAVAEAAVAAAQAAAAVVRLTSSSGRSANARSVTTSSSQEWAAVKIQSAFRGCLARRALRALKGLVKLQALVRGHIERKRTAQQMKKWQALLRAQARVCARRVHILQTPNSTSKSSSCHLHGPATPEKFESPIGSKSMKDEHSPLLKRNGSKSCLQQEKCRNKSERHIDELTWNHEKSSMRTSSTTNGDKSDKNPEIDSKRSQATSSSSRRRSLFSTNNNHVLVADHHCISSKSYTTSNNNKESSSVISLQSGPSPSCEVQSQSPMKHNWVEESPFCTAENSPQYLSASSKDNGPKRSPFGGSRSYICDYSDYPSYMACTESSKAKVRSLSAPKQRPNQCDRSSSSNRYSLNGLGSQRPNYALQGFTNKGYPGSGRLDKLGMPVGYRF